MSSNTPTNVWLIIDSLAFGGIESHVVQLAKGLKQFEASVFVWIVRKYDAPPALCEHLDANDIPHNFLADRPLQSLPTLLSHIKQRSPDVIHAHGYKASLLAKAARLTTGIHQVSTYHAGETPVGLVYLYDIIDRYTAALSSTSIAVSALIQEKLPCRSTYLNNFVDSHYSSPIHGHQTAFVGRLSHEKAADRFVSMGHMFPDQAFDIYGTGPDQDQLSHTAPENVRFHGYQSDMEQVWPQIDVLIICSRFEGLPMTALEAMARGIIVMSLNVGNLAKLIQHGQNGYLFDDFSALCEFYSGFQTLPDSELNQVRLNAQQTIQHSFSPQALIPKLLEIYRPNESI
tara:strand:+ start:1031 stop:2062 length:1032 start_codon:yes stop_codon:yes gene_type:complete